MGKLILPPLRTAEKVIQRTYFVAGRSTMGTGPRSGPEEDLIEQVQGLTLAVLENRRLRYNEAVQIAVDRTMKEKSPW